MTPEEILSHPARVLTRAQREHYLEHGYLFIERFIGEPWLARLRAATRRYLKASRDVSEPNDWYDLAPGHSKAQARVRRLIGPDRDPEFWAFANGPIADVAADLTGPDLTFHHSKINFKWPGAGDANAVHWHQDAAFYPHTNYNLLAIGVYIEETTPEHGPLMVVSDSHEGEIHSHYDAEGRWVGHLSPEDVARIDAGKTVSMPGPAGSITVHNVRSLHGSRPSRAVNMRPLLVNAYAAADAFPYAVADSNYSSRYRTLVRGKPARWAAHDPRPCPIPPDWSAGYPSLYDQQQGKEPRAA